MFRMTDRTRDLPPGSSPRAPGDAAVEEAGAFLDRLDALPRTGARRLSAVDAAALDAVAVACARGAGATELAIGEGLDVLARTGGDVRLGHSGVGDLARERLGIPADQGRRLRRLAERLRSRPLLRDAVMRGEVTLRKAEVVVREAFGSEEAYWVARAKVDTVRRLEDAVRGGPEHAEEDWHRLRIGLPPRSAEAIEVALEVAGILLEPTAPLWKRVAAIAMEFLSSHPVDPRERIAPRPPPSPPPAWARPAAAPPDAARGANAPAAPLPAGGACGSTAAAGRDGGAAARDDATAPDPYELLDGLAGLVRGRAGQDERLGRACLLVRRFGTWRLGFCSFDAWCAERLGLAPSTVRQRMALEHRMRDLPELRGALRAGRLSYEQARLVARVATAADVAVRIEEAAATTCVAYRRALEGAAQRQMWRAGELRAVLPDEVDALLADAIRAARAAPGGGLTPGDALVAIAVHFVLTWKDEVLRRIRATHGVILRDGGLCQVPGCSRAADHVHHVVRRSAGGPLEPWNEVSLCAVHHLRGVHGGSVRIVGTAPGGLRFALGDREVAAARGDATGDAKPQPRSSFSASRTSSSSFRPSAPSRSASTAESACGAL